MICGGFEIRKVREIFEKGRCLLTILLVITSITYSTSLSASITGGSLGQIFGFRPFGLKSVVTNLFWTDKAMLK